MNNSSIKLLVFTMLVLSAFVFTACATSSNNKEKNIEDNEEQSMEEIEFNGKSYVQIFNDDFEGTKLDPKKWAKCPEQERQGGMKNHGWWSDSCSSVQDGNLVIECKKSSSGRYISGGVRNLSKDYTKALFKNAKGLYEIKFKVEEGSGFWYAFWMMADNDSAHVSGSASNGAEIDCFELLPGKSWWNYNGTNSNVEGRFMSTIHWDAYGKEHQSKGTTGIKVLDFDENFYDNWHVYQFLWDDDSYECYLDGKYLWTMKGSEYGNGICNAKGYMKITAEFGEWGGPVCDEIENGGSKKMLVDYVKVYKEK